MVPRTVCHREDKFLPYQGESVEDHVPAVERTV